MIGALLNQYRIIASIGAGGMGEVFRARDTRLNREVAIKVLPKDFVADADRLRRFEQEAKTLAVLNHPNVLTIHDAGVHEGAPYLVSELLEGKTLREEMNGAALPVRKATDYALQIALGLAAAHGKGVIHRDLKPENIFVTKDGRVKILDFGLAKLRNPSPDLRPPSPLGGEREGVRGEAATIRIDADAIINTTEPGMVLGTPAYMSPEQVRGEPADHRADIFAFGCVLYEMLSGTRAFRRNTPVESMNAVLNDTLPELSTTDPKIPLALAHIVERCLEKQPDNRFHSAKDLAFALAEISSTRSPASNLRESERAAWRRTSLVAGTVLILALGGWFYVKFGVRSGSSTNTASHRPLLSTETNKSIAVLPFLNMSADKDNEYFSDGITEEILNALARTPGLRVAARTSAFSFKGKNESVQRIGEALKVGVVLEGSVQRAGSQLRINAHLVNVADESLLWWDRFDRKAEDVFAIQTEVAQRVQEALKVKLLAGSGTNATLAGTDNLEAYDLYLRARQFWNLRTGADVQRAVGLFEQATEKDPKFAAAYAGLASSYVVLSEYASLPVRETNPKARVAARRALELDGRLAEAHAVLAQCAQSDWDWATAEQEYQEALRLNPNHATSHHWYSLLLANRERFTEALAEIRQAQALDPLSPVIQLVIGGTFYDLGRYDETLVEVDKALKLSPDFVPAHKVRGWVFLVQKKTREAIAEFEKVREKTGDTPYALGYLGLAYARAGQTNPARQILERLKTVSASGDAASFAMAHVHLGLGELDQAFAWLERAAESRDVDPRPWKHDPLLADVVKDPRYAALLKKFGLDK